MGNRKALPPGNQPRNMPGKPIQVLVIPFRMGSEPEFAVFHRSDEEMWQFIAGGVEDREDAMRAARREAEEEASIPSDLPFVRLDSVASVPRTAFEETEHWPENLLLYPSIRSLSMSATESWCYPSNTTR